MRVVGDVRGTEVLRRDASSNGCEARALTLCLCGAAAFAIVALGQFAVASPQTGGPEAVSETVATPTNNAEAGETPATNGERTARALKEKPAPAAQSPKESPAPLPSPAPSEIPVDGSEPASATSGDAANGDEARENDASRSAKTVAAPTALRSPSASEGAPGEAASALKETNGDESAAGSASLKAPPPEAEAATAAPTPTDAAPAPKVQSKESEEAAAAPPAGPAVPNGSESIAKKPLEAEKSLKKKASNKPRGADGNPSNLPFPRPAPTGSTKTASKTKKKTGPKRGVVKKGPPPKVKEGELTTLRKRAGNNLVKTKVDGFSFYLPGDLMPGTSPTGGSIGAPDDRFHRPSIRFPIEKGPAYVNSQVWGWGGTFGLGSSECDLRNYSYPWRDNFCESRSWVSGVCPGGIGHQGVDIRAKTCDDDKYWAVAAESGKIIEIGVYGITLRGNSGYEYTYLHVNTPKAKVKRGQRVKVGDKIALISNHYGGTPTSIHLHFEMRRPNPKGGEPILVSPYASLIPAYLRLMSGSKAKAEEALKTATIAPRPKQPPKFKGFSGNGPRGWGGGLRDCSTCPLMKRVPGGSFKIGSPRSESGRDQTEGPQRSIKVTSFVMSRNEVTRRSWRSCVKEGYCNPERKGMTWKSLNHPVTGVSMNDVTGVGGGKKGFLAWLNNKAKRRGRKVQYRLPSEAEWEHALRAGGADPYSTGKTPDPRRIAFKATSYKKFPAKVRERKSPVTRRSLRANRWGFYEMAGNVWEMTADCWARDHRFTPRNGKSRGSNCSLGTMKGGSVFSAGRDVRAATRKPIGASTARKDLGFRVVREPIGKTAKKKPARSAKDGVRRSSKASVKKASAKKTTASTAKKTSSAKKKSSTQKSAAKPSKPEASKTQRSKRFRDRFADD